MLAPASLISITSTFVLDLNLHIRTLPTMSSEVPYLETRILALERMAIADSGKGASINRFNSVRYCPPPFDKLRSLNYGPNKYTYDFEPAPRQNDAVMWYITLLIRDMEANHIGVADMHLRVEPTVKSPPFWLVLPDYTTYCSKLYTFMDRFNEFPLTAWVTFSPGMPGPTEDNLHLKIGTEWILLKDWLLSSQTPAEDLVGERGYRAQRICWKLNGKHFRFADLPTEMRMKVFEFALGPRIYPLTILKDADVRLGLGFRNWHDSSQIDQRHPSRLYGREHTVTGCSAYEPNLALLSINRQTYSEALQAGWEGTRKCFFHPVQLRSVLEAGSRPNFNWLNHLILDFTMTHWFGFFGVRFRDNINMNNGVSLGPILPTLDGLSTLQLWFRSPDDGVSYYPYGMRRVDKSMASFVCCQRTMVDWIMTFAWPFVKDLPKVRLGGILKKDTKDKWNELLALPAKDKDGVMDHAAEQAAIPDTPSADM